MAFKRDTIKFDEAGLVPAIVQDAETGVVLMLGYMNRESVELTHQSGFVTFFSRSRQKLWKKGESSGNVLRFKEMRVDCDGDTLLVLAEPAGPTCHTGADTCFDETNEPRFGFLNELQRVIEGRKAEGDAESSYTKSLFERGTAYIAQKVGEEAVETVIDSLRGDDTRFLDESADLVYHLMVLLADRGFGLGDVEERLKGRHSK